MYRQETSKNRVLFEIRSGRLGFFFLDKGEDKLQHSVFTTGEHKGTKALPGSSFSGPPSSHWLMAHQWKQTLKEKMKNTLYLRPSGLPWSTAQTLLSCRGHGLLLSNCPKTSRTRHTRHTRRTETAGANEMFWSYVCATLVDFYNQNICLKKKNHHNNQTFITRGVYWQYLYWRYDKYRDTGAAIRFIAIYCDTVGIAVSH